MTNPEQREKIARIVDPRAFGDTEILRSLGSFDSRPERQREAYRIADAIVALDPAPESARDRGKAAQEPEGYRDALHAFVKTAAPKALERGAAYTPRPAPDVEHDTTLKELRRQSERATKGEWQLQDG